MVRPGVIVPWGATLRVEKQAIAPFVHVVVRLLLLRKALSNDL